jgi:hypothetical protein
MWREWKGSRLSPRVQAWVTGERVRAWWRGRVQRESVWDVELGITTSYL